MTVFSKLPPWAAQRLVITAAAIAAALHLDCRQESQILHLGADYLAQVVYEPYGPGVVMVRFTFEEAQRLAGKLEAEVRSESQLWNRRSGWKDSAIASLKAALAGVPGGLSKPGSRFWVCDGCYHVNRIAMDHCADCGARAPHAYEPAAAREVRRLREA